MCIYPHIKRYPSSTFSWTLIFCSAAGVTRSTRPMAKSICVAKLVTTEVNSYDAVCEKRGTYMTYIWKIYGKCAKIMKNMEDRWKNRWEKLRTQPSLVISIRLCSNSILQGVYWILDSNSEMTTKIHRILLNTFAYKYH